MSMRMLIGAVGLTGSALFLQGCGGGGDGGVKRTCMAPRLDLVSQSISGTMSVSMSGEMNQTVPPFDFSEKIDFERFNIYMTSSLPPNSTNLTNVTISTQIVNLAEKHFIDYSVVKDPLTGNITKTCTMVPLPVEMLDATVLSTMLREFFSAAECAGSDSTYDTWKFSMSYDGPMNCTSGCTSSVSEPGLVVSFSENVELTTSQDSLLHSARHAEHVDMMANSSIPDSDFLQVMSISSAVPGGPSDADLDPEQFDVDCTTPEGLVDVNTFFTSSFPGIFQKHALATLQAALRPQNVLIAV